MTGRKVLFTGATGFVGGSVLSQFLASSKPELQNLAITVLVRKESEAELLRTTRATPLLFPGLDDSEFLTKTASEYDIVVHCASGFHTSSAEALVRGLGARKERSGGKSIFLHTSGTSNLAEYTMSGQFMDDRTFNDKEDDIYGEEVARQKVEVYSQRSTDVSVVQLGEKLGVRTHIIMSPLVTGSGQGLFRKESHHMPWLAKNAIASKRSEYLEDGSYNGGFVDVEDLAELFEVLLSSILLDKEVRSGREGIYFANLVDKSWLEVAEDLGKVGFELGVLETPDPQPIGLEAAADKIFGGDKKFAELALGVNVRTKPVLGFELGWKPVKTVRDWESSLRKTFEICLKGKEAA